MGITTRDRRDGRHFLPPLLLLLGLGACTSSPVIRPPANPMERGLFYAEAADDGRHGISNPDASSTETTRIVEPAMVDEDSRVEVRVDVASIAAGIRDESTALLALEALTSRSAAMTERIGRLVELVEAQNQVALAFGDLMLSEPATHDSSLAAFTLAREKYEAMAIEQDADPEAIQAALTLLERDLRAEAARSGFTVRMEAFLHSPGRDPVALPLQGYDLLRLSQVERRDRYGLFLAGDELKRFQDLADQTEAAAVAAGRYLEKRAALDETLRTLTAQVVGEYAQLGADATVLARELSAEALSARAESSQGALRAFLAQLSGEAQARLQPSVNSLGSRLAEASARASASGLGPQLSTAANSFTRARTAAANGKLGGIGGGVAESLADAQLAASVLALDELLQGVDEALNGLTGELRDSIRAGWGSSAALVEMRGWEDLYARARSLADRAGNLTLSAGVHDLPAALRLPETLAVPAERIPPTEFDLSLTSRQLGDRILLRTSLLQDARPIGDPVEAHFRVTRFGWHSDMHPSVVLARPVQRTPGAADFRFVPAVSWLHSYLPRPEEKGPLASTMRTFQPSAGLHAAILNFDAEEELEIGLGVNMGLWNGVLQAGFGYNLMANDGEGNSYVFIGSSLIPLVQAVQSGFSSMIR